MHFGGEGSGDNDGDDIAHSSSELYFLLSVVVAARSVVCRR